MSICCEPPLAWYKSRLFLISMACVITIGVAWFSDEYRQLADIFLGYVQK